MVCRSADCGIGTADCVQQDVATGGPHRSGANRAVRLHASGGRTRRGRTRKDGLLRAFYNVCRHHAATVVTETCGSASLLHCPYHGWNYGLDGSLKGMPEFEGVKNFERHAKWTGTGAREDLGSFVFVNLDPASRELNEVSGRVGGAHVRLWASAAALLRQSRLTTSHATGRCL